MPVQMQRKKEIKETASVEGRGILVKNNRGRAWTDAGKEHGLVLCSLMFTRAIRYNKGDEGKVSKVNGKASLNAKPILE